MDRRNFLIGATGVAAGAASESRRPRPNVVVFFTDQQRWDTCGCYGDSPLNLTPNLDRMAARGTLLRNAFTCQPVCAPARASLQTGLFATRTGVWRNGIALPETIPTLARLFGAAGYDTGYIGKWHLANTESKPVPVRMRGGYDYWLASDVLEFTSHPFDFRTFDGDGKEFARPGYRVDAQTDCVIDYIDRHAAGAKPFFLFASYLEPHHQNDEGHFVAPAGYAERHTKDLYVPPDLTSNPKGDWPRELPGYYGSIASLDENLGRVLAALRQRRIDDNTIVLFCSDHGCHFRTRNGEYKRSCHEGSIRVPAVLQGPGLDGGRTVDRLVSLVDWPVTLLDAAGIRAPKGVDGRSVMPLARGKRVRWPDEVFVQISESQTGRAIRTPRWKYSVKAIAPGASQRSSSWAYLEDCLYDLERDPWEQENLVGRPDMRETSDELMAALKRRIVAAGEKEPAIQIRP